MEIWNRGLTSPNLPDQIHYFNKDGAWIRTLENEYSRIYGTNRYELSRTITKDVANFYNWKETYIYYDHSGNAAAGATIFDGGNSQSTIPNTLFTPAWNFASTVDSNFGLVRTNVYLDFSMPKLAELGVYAPTNFDPMTYFSNDYVGYKGLNFNGLTNNDPFNNFKLIDPNPIRYYDFVQSNGNYGPIIFDIDNDGLSINLQNSSSTFIDIDGSGRLIQSAWAAPNDGLLAIDLSADGQFLPDGKIDHFSELTFQYDIELGQNGDSSLSDLAALRNSYDSNKNGYLDRGDDQFSLFVVWKDSNSDGLSQPGELITLTKLDVAFIDLASKGESISLPDGTGLNGISQVIYLNGKSTSAGDFSFAFGEEKSAASVVTNMNSANIKMNIDETYDISYASYSHLVDSLFFDSQRYNGQPSDFDLKI